MEPVTSGRLSDYDQGAYADIKKGGELKLVGLSIQDMSQFECCGTI